MANQSRLRSPTEPLDSRGPSMEESASSFPYKPLDPTVDCIRLVHLEPDKGDLVIRCSLVHATFASKPKYEALSYTWGDDNANNTILLDGVKFRVGDNLHNALRHLRYSQDGKERILWIDAICINQADVEERNKQVGRMMPYIYARALVVLIWLGYRNISHQDIPENDGLGDYAYGKYPIDKSDMLQVCGSDYWTRIWVIQEMGKARRLKICYHGIGNPRSNEMKLRVLGWDHFVSHIRQYPVNENAIQRRIAEQLEDRYGESSLLRNLIKAHQEAQSKDPRDKIYGLVGLALDCNRSYPIDYNKSLPEVYEDFVLFCGKEESGANAEVPGLCRLTLRTLGLEGVDILEDLETERRRSEDEDMVPKMLHIESHLIGVVSFVGPSYEEIISSVDKIDEWEQRIQKEVSLRKSSEVHKMSDKFLETVEALDEKSEKTIFCLDTKPWEGAIPGLTLNNPIHAFSEWVKYMKTGYSVGTTREERTEDIPAGSSVAKARLILVSVENYQNRQKIRIPAHTLVGLAASNVRAGDCICALQDMERAVILRFDSAKMEPADFTVRAKKEMQVVGCAGLAKRPSAEIRGQEQDAIFSTPDWSISGNMGVVDLLLDVPTAYKLACWK